MAHRLIGRRDNPVTWHHLPVYRAIASFPGEPPAPSLDEIAALSRIPAEPNRRVHTGP